MRAALQLLAPQANAADLIVPFDDLVEGVWRLVNTPIGEPVNMGNPDEVTILEVAQEVLALTGSTAGVAHLPLPEGDPKLRQPNIDRARTLLGWEPSVARSTGFYRTLMDMHRRMTRPSIARELAGVA